MHTPSTAYQGIRELDKKCLTSNLAAQTLSLSLAMHTTGRYRPVVLTEVVILKEGYVDNLTSRPRSQ